MDGSSFVEEKHNVILVQDFNCVDCNCLLIGNLNERT